MHVMAYTRLILLLTFCSIHLKASSSRQKRQSTPEASDQSNCTISVTIVSDRTNVCSGELIFKEEFDKNSLRDLRKWEKEVKIPRKPDYPFHAYLKDALAAEDGRLKITPMYTETVFHKGFLLDEMDLRLSCTGSGAECFHKAVGADIIPPIITGKVNTRNSFSFKYGKIEVKAKFPVGDWLIPEISLEPVANVYGNTKYESGLIKIASSKGNAAYSKELYGGPILSDKEPFRTMLFKKKLGLENWNRNFHVYTLVWKLDSLEYFVDGEKYGTVEPGEGFYKIANEYDIKHASLWNKSSPMAPLDEMFYISLGLRVGGLNDFADKKGKPWKNTNPKAKLNFWRARDKWAPTWETSQLQVDYVRVYSL